MSLQWQITRRRALAAGIACAVTMPGGFTPASDEPQQPMGTELQFGISQMRLLTADLDPLHRFYEETLGLPAQRTGNELLVTAGGTRIVFEVVDAPEQKPFYHFAFNIPENKLESARTWQKQRTELVRRGNTEVIHFAHWNAHSVFFNDPAGNILEYIARHDLDNAAEGDFSPADILYASEIGLVVDDVAATVKELTAKLGLGVYRDNSEFFASLGDEHALVLLVKRDRLWTPDRTRPAKVYPTTAAIRGLQAGTISLDPYQYQVTSEVVLSDAQQHFLREAVSEARRSAETGGVPLGSVIVKDGTIIGRGHNRRLQDGDPIMHADMVSLRSALQHGGLKACQGATAYCTGMPCQMCAAALVYWGVREVIVAQLNGYPDNRPFFTEHGVRLIVVRVDEAQQLLDKYLKGQRGEE